MRRSNLGLTIPCLFLLACKPGPGSEGTAGSEGSTGSTGDGVSTGGTDPSDPTTGSSSGETGTETGGGVSNSGTTTNDPSMATSVGPTGDPDTGPATTGLGDGCDAFSNEKECAGDPDCMAVVGEAQDFAGCSAGPQFLACIDAMPCDAVLVTVCRDGTEESYQLPNGCVPPGFTPCDGPGQACGGGGGVCADLPTNEACKLAGCAPILGAKHTVIDGGICADFNNMEYLGCFDPEVPCPPFVPTVCPKGEKEPAWDVPSGCIPAGFEICGELAPECK